MQSLQALEQVLMTATEINLLKSDFHLDIILNYDGKLHFEKLLFNHVLLRATEG